MMISASYKKVLIALASVAIIFASTGFMIVLELRCTMMDAAASGMDADMSCCQTPASIPQRQPYFASTLQCNMTTLAGLPSSLISTLAQERSTIRPELPVHNVVLFTALSELRTPKPEILRADLSSPFSPPQERYVLSSAFLL